MSKKLSDKDLKDWDKFIKSKDKINPKEELNRLLINKNKSLLVIDLHGYSLDQANKFVEKTINECFEKQISKVNIITGKGMRSKSAEDPYKSSELSILKHSIPELQGRLPIRVELDALNSSDFKRILKEPDNSLIKQYKALLKTENVDLEFSEDGIDTIANLASEVNSSVENIGARRLHTIIERVLDEISFTATDRSGEKIVVDSKYVKENLGQLVKDNDLSKFIL